MAIRVFTGHQGHGKTLKAVRFVVRTLEMRKGARAYGNVQVDHPRYTMVDWDFLLHPRAPRGIYLMDELAAGLDAQAWAKVPAEVLNGLREERKSGRDLVGTAQTFDMLNGRLRSQTSWVHHCDAFLPLPSRYDQVTDDLKWGGHPLLFRTQNYRGAATLRMNKDTRLGAASWSSWWQLKPYAEKYDTKEFVEVAGYQATSAALADIVLPPELDPLPENEDNHRENSLLGRWRSARAQRLEEPAAEHAGEPGSAGGGDSPPDGLLLPLRSPGRQEQGRGRHSYGYSDRDGNGGQSSGDWWTGNSAGPGHASR